MRSISIGRMRKVSIYTEIKLTIFCFESIHYTYNWTESKKKCPNKSLRGRNVEKYGGDEMHEMGG